MDATVEELQLIPRKALLGNPDKMSATLSPDGLYMSYLAPLDGVLNVWLRTIGKQDDRPLTRDTGRGIQLHFWSYNGEHILYQQDRDGDENFLLYAVSTKDGTARCLTPPEEGDGHPVRVFVLSLIPEKPDEAIAGINRRDQSAHDLYHLDLRTGKLELIQQSRPEISQWLIDHAMAVRGYVEETPGGEMIVALRPGESGDFRETLRLAYEDVLTSYPLGFTADNGKLYLISSTRRNAAALVLFDPGTGRQQVLLSDPEYDVSGVILHPTKHYPDAAQMIKDRVEWKILDPALEKDMARIKAACAGDPGISSRTLDDKHWLVYYRQDDGPLAYYIYDRESGKLDFLFHQREALVGLPLVPLMPVSFAARDGLQVHGYLALPRGFESPGPLVLNVHGGPWGRDTWGFNPEMQLFANRGYACLQVNFRGSTGYGKDFTNAGDREWGGKMQNDLTDAVLWAVEQGIADPAKVVIYGGSYGGYATLAGVTFTPDLYCAGAEVVGPSNMETFLNTIPPYWESARKQFDRRVGRIPRYTEGERAGQPKADADMDAAEKAEVEFMRSRSPLYFADRVRVPMLIAQGANDPRVNKAESDQFVAALRARGLSVEYVVYENEGHGFARPENRLDFYRRLEKFLADVLGGRYEP